MNEHSEHNESDAGLADKDFHRKIMEIGYLGAFYGMTRQAGEVFSFYADAQHHELSAQIAAKLGEALILIGQQDHLAAAQLLEKALEEFGADQIPEAQAFLVLAYKKAKIRADRVEGLLAEMKTSAGPVADAVQTLALG